jgi:hypothetical protein
MRAVPADEFVVSHALFMSHSVPADEPFLEGTLSVRDQSLCVRAEKTRYLWQDRGRRHRNSGGISFCEYFKTQNTRASAVRPQTELSDTGDRAESSELTLTQTPELCSLLRAESSLL